MVNVKEKIKDFFILTNYDDENRTCYLNILNQANNSLKE